MKLKITIAFAALSSMAIAQVVPYWKLGGNPPTGPVDGVNTFNNYLGTASPNNTAVRFGSNGIDRLLIHHGSSAQHEGRVAIGNSLTTGFSPGARLHLVQFGTAPNGDMFASSSDHSVSTYWKVVTGANINTATEKFRLTVTPNTQSNTILSTMVNSDMLFETNAKRRVTIFRDNMNLNAPNGGGMAINLQPTAPLLVPRALLTIGQDGGSSGLKPWMEVGTTLLKGDDHAYFGLKTEGTDSFHAVVAWGDNNDDYLRFVFTSANPLDGNEVARFSPNGKNGMGNFYQYGINTNPVRRLEVLDVNPNTGVNANEPQLRLTYQYNAVATSGIFSEFQTTSAGDMYFNTRSNGNTRNFGFHKTNPLNTVEITSQSNSPYLPANGSSGLRFTNLKSTNTPLANGTNGLDNTKVLSVDQNGDVVLVNGAGSTVANSGITVNAGVTQLGVDCALPLATKTANGLVTDRVVYLNSKTLTFADAGKVGIGTNISNCTVGNKLEITSGTGMPYYPLVATNGSSGLRLSFLTSAKTPLANGTNGVDNTKVLSVDQNGDVVLVSANAPTSASGDNGLSTSGPTAGLLHLGQNVGAVGNPSKLLNHREIPMNNQNIYFTQTTKNNGIGVGLAGGSVLDASVDVFTWDSIKKNGVKSLFYTSTYAPNNLTHSGHFTNFLVNHPLDVNIVGVRGDAWFGSGFAAGVMGTAYGPDCYSNYGGRFIASGSSNENIGVFGAIDTTAGVGGANYAGYFVGDVFTTGGATSGTGYLTASDQNIKTQVTTLNKSLGIIKQLRPVSYNFDKGYVPQLNLNNHKNYGFIAQEVAQILPDLVEEKIIIATYDSLGKKIHPSKKINALNYDGIIPFLVNAIQEQQTIIDAFKIKDSLQDVRMANIEALLNQCCQNPNNMRVGTSTPLSNQNAIDIELSDKDVIVLTQNVPNPFAEQTIIAYNVPNTVAKAQILFYNAMGQIIETVEIKTRGKGKLNVFASDLSSGLYHYTLVADGKVVDSKKMVRE